MMKTDPTIKRVESKGRLALVPCCTLVPSAQNMNDYYSAMRGRRHRPAMDKGIGATLPDNPTSQHKMQRTCRILQIAERRRLPVALEVVPASETNCGVD